MSATIGSLFSGIGGLELGLERAGLGPVSWQVERDPFCRKVLAKHWPEARRFEDVKEVGKLELVPVDIICGGFPCQDISTAGAGAGLRGERSGLWFNFLRIIRELVPRFVIVENVSALLIRGLGDVLGGLAESGYNAEWDCIPAQAVGAPHRRDRLFLVARRISDPSSDAIRHKPERRKDSAQPPDGGNAEPIHVGGKVADADGRGLQAQRGRGLLHKERAPRGNDAHGCNVPHAWPPSPGDMHAWGRMPDEAQPAICRIANGVPRGMDRDRLKALGNAVVPQVAEAIGRALLKEVIR